jgi:hypothetical protein
MIGLPGNEIDATTVAAEGPVFAQPLRRAKTTRRRDFRFQRVCLPRRICG